MIRKALIDPMEFNEQPREFVYVDSWQPEPEDMVFKTVRGAILMDVSKAIMQEPNMELDTFVVSTKRSYNSEKMRDHIVQYLNYFEKFYDWNSELQMLFCRMKVLIDCEPCYTKEAFIEDLKHYIMSGPIAIKAQLMVEDNFQLNLTYKNLKNPNLQYNNKHGKILMHISLLMNILIPLLCHFMYSRKVQNSSDFLLEVYDILIDMYDVDIYGKLYETASSNVQKSANRNKGLWNQQDVRGINMTTHAMQSVINILLNIIPKYVFNDNLVHFNYKSIIRNTGFQVLDRIQGPLYRKRCSYKPFELLELAKAHRLRRWFIYNRSYVAKARKNRWDASMRKLYRSVTMSYQQRSYSPCMSS